MGKKLKKIKVNKFWKNIFKNRPLMILVAVFILAIIFSSPTAQQYFKATGSSAAGIDLGGSGISPGGVPEQPLWRVAKIISQFGNEVVSDVDGRYLVFISMDEENLGNFTRIYLQNLENLSANPIMIPKGNNDINAKISSPPRISGNVVVWSQFDSNAGNQSTDIYQYSINTGLTTQLTFDDLFENHVDLDGDFFAYAVSETDWSGDSKNIVVKHLNDNSLAYIIPNQQLPIHDLRLDNNNLVWEEHSGNDSNSQIIYKSDLNTPGPSIQKLIQFSTHTIEGFNISNDKLVAYVWNILPWIRGVYVYSLEDGSYKKIADASGSLPNINKNQIIYRKGIGGDIQSLMGASTQNNLQYTIWSVYPLKEGIELVSFIWSISPIITTFDGINTVATTVVHYYPDPEIESDIYILQSQPIKK